MDIESFGAFTAASPDKYDKFEYKQEQGKSHEHGGQHEVGVQPRVVTEERLQKHNEKHQVGTQHEVGQVLGDEKIHASPQQEICHHDP